jgi:hypothetical protein
VSQFAAPGSCPEQLREYGSDVIASARENISYDSFIYVKLFDQIDRADLYPGCFQFPLAYEANGKICTVCPFAKPCAESNEKYLASKKEQGMGVNGYDDHRRKLDRERQRRRRAKLRAIPPATAASE